MQAGLDIQICSTYVGGINCNSTPFPPLFPTPQLPSRQTVLTKHKQPELRRTIVMSAAWPWLWHCAQPQSQKPRGDGSGGSMEWSQQLSAEGQTGGHSTGVPLPSSSLVTRKSCRSVYHTCVCVCVRERERETWQGHQVILRHICGGVFVTCRLYSYVCLQIWHISIPLYVSTDPTHSYSYMSL